MKRLFIIAVGLCLCTGCASNAAKSRKKKQQLSGDPSSPAQSQQQAQHRLVGTIVSVNEEQHFVLIDTESSYAAPVGAALKSFTDGNETAVLTVSPEAKPPFMIADIVSGAPQKGDQVFQ